MNDNKKYVFTGLTTEVLGRTLKQIQRISDGLIGGWIEKEENLSQRNNAWVYPYALVCGDARVCGNARVHGNAQVHDNARIFGNAQLHGDARVLGDAMVSGNAQVCGDARIFGDALVHGNARVCGNAWVTKTEDLIHIDNLQYSITVTQQNCVIGCHIKTHKEWLKVTLREAIQMGLDRHNYKFFKQLLPILFKQVGKGAN